MKIIALGKIFIPVLISGLASCSSSIQKEYSLGDPASISKAPAPAIIQPGQGIKLQAKPLKQTVEKGEPIYLALQVTNQLPRQIRIPGGLRPGEGLLEVTIQKPDGKMQAFSPMTEGDFDGQILLNPAQTVGTNFPVFFGSHGWYFTEAGEYLISANLKIPAEKGFSSFNSEPVRLTVKPSEAGDFLLSHEGGSRFDAGKFLLWRSGDHLRNGSALLDVVSKRFPDSALASYIFAAHAQNYSEPFANYQLGKVRAADCKAADPYRKSINKGQVSPNILIEDQISQAKCYAETRSWKEAAKALEVGETLCNNKPEFGTYQGRISEMKRFLLQHSK